MVQENSLNGKVLVVCGPTASGKTSLAVSIAEKYNGEVISADSVSVYKRLNIGSAKPSKEEMRTVPHYMIDIVDIFDDFSVSEYEKTALPIIKDVLSRGELPIICGGTGFYINSLLYKQSYGFSCGDEDFRRRYDEKIKIGGKKAVWDELYEIDPVTAEKLHYNDSVRVVRALEIYYLSGVKKSDIVDPLMPRFDFLAVMPSYEREVLYGRIDQRVDLMIKNGLKTEVEGLIADGVTLENQCMQGIGYKESYEALINNREIPSDEIKLNSRHYAKRQLTFFKKMQPYHVNMLDEKFEYELYKKIDDFL